MRTKNLLQLHAEWLSKMTINDRIQREFQYLLNHLNDFIYFNKSFHSRMSFDSDTTDYETTHERLEAKKADDIIIQMKELLNFDCQQLEKTKQIIKAQINKHKWDVIYEVNNWIWLFSRNIKTIKSCKNLKDKQLKLY